jgi:hypothetical protein
VSHVVSSRSFASIWGTDELVVSYDAINLMRPWSYDPAWGNRAAWYHTDQPASLSPEQIAAVRHINALFCVSLY